MREIKFEFLYKGIPFRYGSDDCRWFKKVYTLDQLIEESLSKLSDVHHQAKLIAKRQFTGLRDKNGTDIYKGDILSYSTNYEPYNCVIEWNDSLGSCGCCHDECESVGFVGRVLEGSNFTYSKLATDYNEMKIIGNIYQNPELLEPAE